MKRLFGLAASASLVTMPVAAPSLAKLPIAAHIATDCAPFAGKGSPYAAIPGTKPLSCQVTATTVYYRGVYPNGNETTVECAWKPGDNDQPVFDPAYSEVGDLDGKTHLAQWVQQAGNVIVAKRDLTWHKAEKEITVTVQSFDIYSATLASGKETIDMATNTAKNFQKAEPFVKHLDVVMDAATKAAGFCNAYVQERGQGGWLTNDDYSPERAKADMQQRQNALAAMAR